MIEYILSNLPAFLSRLLFELIIDTMILGGTFYLLSYFYGPYNIEYFTLGCMVGMGMYLMKMITAQRCNNEYLQYEGFVQFVSMFILATASYFLV